MFVGFFLRFLFVCCFFLRFLFVCFVSVCLCVVCVSSPPPLEKASEFLYCFSGPGKRVHICARVCIRLCTYSRSSGKKTRSWFTQEEFFDGDNNAKQKDTSLSLASEGHARSHTHTHTETLQALCIIRAKRRPLMNVTYGGWDAAGQTSPLINWEHSSPF